MTTTVDARIAHPAGAALRGHLRLKSYEIAVYADGLVRKVFANGRVVEWHQPPNQFLANNPKMALPGEKAPSFSYAVRDAMRLHDASQPIPLHIMAVDAER